MSLHRCLFGAFALGVLCSGAAAESLSGGRFEARGDGGTWSELRTPSTIGDDGNVGFSAAAQQTFGRVNFTESLSLSPIVSLEVNADSEGSLSNNTVTVAAGLRLRQSLENWGYASLGVRYAYEDQYEQETNNDDVQVSAEWATWWRRPIAERPGSIRPLAVVANTWGRVRAPGALNPLRDNDVQILASGEAGLAWLQFARIAEVQTAASINYSSNSEQFGFEDTWSLKAGPRLLVSVRQNGALRVGANFVSQSSDTADDTGVEAYAGWNLWW